MWLLVFLFFAVTLLIGWTLFGYLVLIWCMGVFRKHAEVSLPDHLPLISVIVPCYDEADQVLDKLRDLRELDYPTERLEVVFADGGSVDGTADLLEKHISAKEPFRVVRCPRSGKIQQINHVLPDLRGALIVNTDADARLSPDALRWLAAEFAGAPNVWVVGLYCRPEDTIAIERYWWDSQNKGRFLETDAGTSSIVIAQCYAFRRGLIREFPDDVVADDIYVAFEANTRGFRTVYSRRATALETRGPTSYAEFVPHKFRKSNAFLRESLRFLYRLPEMPGFCKMVLITRVLQQLLLPWMALFWLLIAGVLLTMYQIEVLAFGIGLLLLLFVATSRAFASTRLPDGGQRYSLATVIKGYALMNLIMLATGVSYPFFSQGSSYSRLRGDAEEPDLAEAGASSGRNGGEA